MDGWMGGELSAFLVRIVNDITSASVCSSVICTFLPVNSANLSFHCYPRSD